MIYIAIIILAFFLFVFIVSLCERQYLVGDTEPVQEPFPYPPSSYWSVTKQNAAMLGLQHEGDYATRKNSSVVKGLESVWTTANASVIISIIGASFSGMKTRKTILRSRLQNGMILESCDESGTVDLSKTVDRKLLLNAGLDELMAFHLQRVVQSGSFAMPFNRPVLTAIDEINLMRGRRLVELGLAKWADPGRTTIRMSFRGAWNNLVQSFFKQGSRLQGQSHRMAIRRAGS